jgi:hypothetical protein
MLALVWWGVSGILFVGSVDLASFLALVFPAHHKLALKRARCDNHSSRHCHQLPNLCSPHLGAVGRSPQYFRSVVA